MPGHRIRRERLPADEHAIREPRHPARLAVRGGEHSVGRGSGGRGERGVAGEPGGAGAVRRGVPTLSMPQAVARYFIEDRQSIVVAGTHGKTTTTSLAAWSLFALGADPSFLVGGVPKELPVSHRLGKGRHFVIEGDEYDTAYFDKGPKFLHYRPRIVLLTSVEFDHADIYRDLDHVRGVVPQTRGDPSPDGLLVACADYPDVVAVAREARCPVIFYATRDGALPAGSGGEAWAVRGTGESGGMTGFRMEGAGAPSTSASRCRGSTTRPMRRASRSS